MWKYYAFKIAGFSLSRLPRKAGYFGAMLVADFAYIFFPRMGAGVADNMRHVLGTDADDADIKRAVREVLRNVAKNYFDLIKLPRMRLDEIKSLITANDWQYLENAMAKKRGVILVTSHLGSFDVAAQYLAVRSVKTTAIVEPLNPPVLLKHITALRESHGVSFIPGQTGALESLMRALHRGEAILIACDRDIAGNGLTSVFFGEETKLPTVAVKIAMRTGAIVIPVFNRRERNGRYVVTVEPAVDILNSGNDAIAKNVAQVAQVMEKHIRQCPEQWISLSSIWPKKAEPVKRTRL